MRKMIGISFLYILVIAQMPTSLQAQSAARLYGNRTSNQLRLLNRLRREPEATSTTTTTVSPLSSNLYENEVVVTPTSPILKSRIKKQGVFLTLDLRPKPPLLLESPRIDSFTTPPAIREPESTLTTTASIQKQTVRLTATTVPSSSTKSIKILDRLSQLTNMKLKSASLSSQGTNYGAKNRPTIKDIIARRNESLGGEARNDVAYQSSRVPTIRMVRPKQSDFRTGNNKKETVTKPPEKLTKEEDEEEEDDNSAENSESDETLVDSNHDVVNKTLISKVGGHIASIINKPPLPLTEATLKSPATKSSTVSAVIVSPTTGNPIKNSEGQNESIAYNQEESRFITADEIGGARPTQTPFHFTTPPPTVPTTTEARIVPQIQRNSNQYNKAQSPHNFIYAPTQDPIAVAHNEDDFDGEDFEHFRAAHQTFGTKVGTDATTPIAPRADSPSRPSPKFYSVTEGPALPVRMLRKKPQILIKTTTPPPPAPPIVNSILESSKGSNNINEQLPFYKEQGGIFEHPKYSTSQINSNEIQFSERLKQNAGVKYAPKSPAAQQSQNNLYSPNQYNNHHQQPPPQIPVQPTPAYIPAQQPLYVAPTQPAYAPQANYNPHNNYNNPVPNYYQPVPAPPVAAPGYYPAPHQTPPPPPTLAAPVQHFQPPVIAPVPPVQYHQPAYQPQAQPAVVYNQQPAYVHHVQPAQQQPQHQYQQPQPIPAPPVQISRSSLPGNAYYTPSLSSGPTYRFEGGRPPPRHDPDSDTYYGSPDAGPEKPQSTKSKPERRKLTRPEPSYEDSRERSKPRKDDYDRRPPPPPASRRNHEERPPPQRSPPEDYYRPPPPPPPRRAPSRPPPRRNEHYDDYETDPNEQVRDVVHPADEGVRTNEKEFDESFDRVGQSFYKPTADDYGPAQSPNFAHPNIQYDGGRRPQQQRPAPPPARQYSEPSHDARRGPDRYRDTDYNDETTDRGVPVLDPIYTRTIKQYDDELRRNRPSQPPPPEEEEEEHPREEEHAPEEDHHEEPEQPERGHSKPRGQYRDEPPPAEEEEEEEPEEEEERPPPRRQQQKQRDDEEEEEEEEEEERPPPRRQQQRDDEEEEEEEETREKPQKERPQQQEEEEEEEEEEEQPKKQEKGQKKKPPKKPKGDEKAGSLDDDILGIEREFGGGFGNGGGGGGGNGGPVVYHPVLGR